MKIRLLSFLSLLTVSSMALADDSFGNSNIFQLSGSGTTIDLAVTFYGPTVSSQEENGANKELMVAASPDAIAFLAADGKAPQSAILLAAFKALSAHPELASLSDEEKAQAVIYLSSLN